MGKADNAFNQAVKSFPILDVQIAMLRASSRVAVRTLPTECVALRLIHGPETRFPLGFGHFGNPVRSRIKKC